MNPSPRAGVGARLLRAAVFAAVCAVLSATAHALAACTPVPWWAVVGGFLAVLAVAAPLAGRPRSTATVVALLTGGQLALHSVFGLAQQRAAMPTGGSDAIVRTAAKLTCGAGPTVLSPAAARRILTNAGLHPADLSHATAAPGAGAMQGMPGMAGMPGMDSMSGAGAGTGSLAGLEGLLPSLPMVLGHLLAALATGWLLRRGDLALLRIAQLSAHGGQGFGGMAETLTDAARLRALRAALALTRRLLAGLPGTCAQGAHTAHGPYDIPLVPAGEALQHTVIRRGPPAAFALAA
jgi:hypothetical protein